MPVVLPLRGGRNLAKAGIPSDPPADAPKTEYALSLQRITNLVSTPELFFEMNSLFQPLKPHVDKALQTLLKAGIINYADQKPKRRKGCGGCSRRKLLAFALQFASRFQTIVLRAQQDEDLKRKLESELRAYIERKTPAEIRAGMPIVLYARLKNNKIRKVVL